ncbi:MAG: hypothetical protein IAE98_02625 [Candidatus Kapabacteria bacterium]|nr:hypothetical protein [Candidatus Kapabacteria bacterium]
MGKVLHSEFYGKRDNKYEKLIANSLISIEWNTLNSNSPNFFFIDKNFNDKESYEKGYRVDDLFIQSNAGLATEFDELVIKNSKKEAEELLNDLSNKSALEILSKYHLNPKKIGKIDNAVKDIIKNKPVILSIDYRPFDSKFTIYTGVSNGLMGRPRNGIMKHMLHKNLALLTCRQQTSFNFQHVFLSNKISERCSVSLQTGEVNYVFPLYLYPDSNGQENMEQSTARTPNLDLKIVEQIAAGLGLEFVAEKEEGDSTFAPIDILDYIYAVLHSPAYREKYKEFLKIDFPRIPFPTDKEKFWELVRIGGEIRELHLLESKIFDNINLNFPIEGSGEVTRKMTTKSIGFELTDKANSLGKVWINDLQYFGDVPLFAWEFYIGGYQPAQKWLKDRHGRTLGYDDVQHYRKIIIALTETARLMQEIDKVGVE